MKSFTRIQRTAWSLTALLLLMVSNTFAADPPNIVFILSDDQAWSDYGFMGHADIKTPHLDKLASSSLFFDRGYVAAPICRPSLASLVTGLFPHQHGVTGNDVAWGPDRSGYFSAKRHELDAPLRAAFHQNASFIRLLTSNGYLAHQSGKWWEGSWKDGGFTHGMTHGNPKRGGRHGDDGLTIGRTSMKPVTGFIDHAVEQKNPFLLWYAPFLPHTPHNPPKRLLEKYTMPGRAKDVAKYYAMIEWFDETCGELLAYLNEKDLTKNTIVIYICDNGWAARSTRPNDPHQKSFGHFALRSKASPYENGTRTPIMISWPGHVKPKKSKHLAHAIDIFPTIAAAVGLKTPEHLTGINLLDEEAVKNRKAVFGVNHSTHNMSPHNPDETLQYIWCVEDNWKLLVRYPGKDLTKWRKLHDWDKKPVRLYDVTKDPHETKELSEAHPEVVARLKKTIEAWRAATKKPATSAGDPPFVPLFNGKDLTNFQTKDADKFWRIEDGVLIGENDPKKKGHYLWTTKKYSDFILDFDAKWKGTTKRGVDTGIELRKPKLQLQLGISGSLRVDMTGSFYAGRKGYPKSGQATEAKRLLNPEGEWNSFRLQAKGNTFSCWINGKKASEYTDAKFSGAAPLALQIHGGVVMKVEYRNLRIADLAAGEEMTR